MIESFLYYIVQISNTPCNTIQLPITVVPQFWLVHEHRRIAIRNETKDDNINDWVAHDWCTCFVLRMLFQRVTEWKPYCMQVANIDWYVVSVL